MRLFARASLLAALGAILAIPAAQAQSDILLRLRSGSPLGDRFRVDSAGGLVALGSLTVGIIPATGAGSRLMWYPFKNAFRAGYADAGGQFDDVKIGYYSWAGGNVTSAPGNYAFAMGNQNMAEAQCGVAIGSGNNVYGNASDGFATCGVALGLNNSVKDQAGVALGQNAWSDGDAAVAIGYRSTADADYSMAFGYRASTNGHTGAKVFGDASTTDSIEAVANNEFAVRAAGGFRFRSNATLTNGCNIAAGGASITCASSRTLKENYFTVDGEDVLRRMRDIPVTTWNYIDEGRASRHMGPFSEDFWNAFGLGDDPRGIGHLDIDGVNFAGIKALEERTRQLQAREAEVDRLRLQVQSLEARLQRLEARVAGTAAP
ncbi:MAG TPA: tail fiber domain-containing protein [Longimicrobium sp.]|nr:tail fiber domain-containing protein [Longimicrobium sp.]